MDRDCQNIRCRKARHPARMAYLFLTPSFLGVTVFFVLPFLDVVRRSFSDAMGRFFVGLENYESVWNNQAFRLAGGNTICFLAAALPLLFTGSLVLSLMVYETKNCKGLFKTSLILPMAVPAAAMVLVWKLLLCPDGAVNQLLMALTGQIWDRDWVNGRTAFPMLVATYLWKNTGYTVVLWLAGILSIPNEYIEAAKVDGAGRFICIRYIILPNLKGSFYTIVILSFLNSFKIYREAYLVAGSYPQQDIYLLQHLFNNWFVNLDLDKMAAAAVCVGGFLFAVIMLLQRMWDRQN